MRIVRQSNWFPPAGTDNPGESDGEDFEWMEVTGYRGNSSVTESLSPRPSAPLSGLSIQ